MTTFSSVWIGCDPRFLALENISRKKLVRRRLIEKEASPPPSRSFVKDKNCQIQSFKFVQLTSAINTRLTRYRLIRVLPKPFCVEIVRVTLDRYVHPRISTTPPEKIKTRGRRESLNTNSTPSLLRTTTFS